MPANRYCASISIGVIGAKKAKISRGRSIRKYKLGVGFRTYFKDVLDVGPCAHYFKEIHLCMREIWRFGPNVGMKAIDDKFRAFEVEKEIAESVIRQYVFVKILRFKLLYSQSAPISLWRGGQHLIAPISAQCFDNILSFL